MNRIITMTAVAWLTLTVSAQTAQEEIQANKYLSGSNYVDYDRQLSTIPLTPSPEGYEPYYMSHYGRHGSRWLIDSANYSHAIEPLRKAHAWGKLTAKGEEALAALERFVPTTTLRLGDLTTVGERQHHGIARRMVSHFPEIFLKPGVAIDARSTVVVRCILSMTAECEEFAAANPTARIHNDVSQAFQYYLNGKRDGIVKALGRKGRKVRKGYNSRVDTCRVIQSLFSDTEWARDSVRAWDFIYNLFEVTSNMQSHDTDIDLFPLFTHSEIYEQWRLRNIGWYIDYAAAPVTQGLMPFAQRHLLRNIIETADTITQTQATMRFGHESVLMPLSALMELGNCGAEVENLDTLDHVWRNYRIFPMASNIQLIFYRRTDGQEGDILVKALLNEREVTLPVPTSRHPYYPWSSLRQYYLDKLSRFEELSRVTMEGHPTDHP